MTLPHLTICPPHLRWIHPEALEQLARARNIEPALLRALRRQEAGKGGFDHRGRITMRFEPHKMPRSRWVEMRFAPRPGQKSWRASLKLSEAERDRMFEWAVHADLEAAYAATSWGALQTMGFNHRHCGFPSAVAMVESLVQGAPHQWAAGIAFAEWRGALDKLRAHDFVGFALDYNGDGQPEKYGAELAEKYRLEAGVPAIEVLRIGSRGASVVEAQQALAGLGYYTGDIDGGFGPLTRDAVQAFQSDVDLSGDGVIGDATWTELRERAAEAAVPTPRPRPAAEPLDRLAEGALARAGNVGTGALGGSGALLGFSQLPETTQWVVVALIAVLIAAAGAFVFWRLVWRPSLMAKASARRATPAPVARA